MTGGVNQLPTRMTRPGTYRLRGGRLGTEREAVREAIQFWETKRQQAEDRLEELRTRLQTASDDREPASGPVGTGL